MVHFPGSYASLPDIPIQKTSITPILSGRAPIFVPISKSMDQPLPTKQTDIIYQRFTAIWGLWLNLEVLAIVLGRRSQLPIFGPSACVKLITAACRALGIQKPSLQSFMDLEMGGENGGEPDHPFGSCIKSSDFK